MTTPEGSAGPRHKTRISRTLNTRLQAQVRRRHHVKSYVVYDIVRHAARAACVGIPLPPGRKRGGAPPMPSDPVEINWSQGEEEYQQWKAAIDAAGSSLRAVITAGVQQYVADPRVVLPPDWTPFPPAANSENED